MTAPIEFYFDFASPYGYLASTQIDALGNRFEREVLWRPFLVGASFKLTGRKPLIEVPLIRDYMRHDIERFARLLNVPFVIPDRFPIAAIAASRAYYWLEERDAAHAKTLAQQVYRDYFADNRDIASKRYPADLALALGLPPDQLLDAVQSQAVKDRFRTENDRALSLGVFGSPFIVVDGEAFWGADRLPQVEQWLAHGGW